MMEAITKDTRFTDMVGELLKKQKKGEEIIMCEYIDMLEARGEARGIVKGEARGKKIGKRIGKKVGKKVGKEIGESRLASLLAKLYSLGRDEDAKLAVYDRQARGRFYKELRIE